MSTGKVKKFLYAFVHIIAPIMYLAISLIWGYLFTSKPLWINITDNLSILAIWYIIISILWLVNIAYIDKQAEILSKKSEKPNTK
ncbi:hypothetical protein CFK37_17910 [Virgibacillus phasianinus]|uniref:Uncharacterized protein n=1 Tax=Virgibacillus phasianinus TaxID=2017483 RepID=A0A220U6Z5_9BACI|nr:hypothetical protein CFK37_17910 [Virgibacillus phasianinus]